MTQEKDFEELLEICKALIKAFHNYEMEVDEEPPYEHRVMMEKAEKVITKVGLFLAARKPTHVERGWAIKDADGNFNGVWPYGQGKEYLEEIYAKRVVPVEIREVKE